ncbi:phosphate signaling complex protein PhoU [Corynebacterium ulceribovis]|uniref:phosphate signaling complex protein PhoU n=1 Tax=Corynebacterium ulceribovis TaxID=487732 RepID=UPI0003624D3F|nr:phosphate signaling complex protein PhoU [Corynebacterium ulceribovis]
MRTVYREKMANFSHDLVVMCDLIHEQLSKATFALLESDLQAAEDVISSREQLEALQDQADSRAYNMLLLEGPVARDLRQLVSGLYIVQDLARMGQLSMHIAEVARRRHPKPALPDFMHADFARMAAVCDDMANRMRQVLLEFDPASALQLAVDDDEVDALHQEVFGKTTRQEWLGTTVQAVDVTLLSRYFERFADHAVEVGARVVYLATGYRPADYIPQVKDPEQARLINMHFETLERQFGPLTDDDA